MRKWTTMMWIKRHNKLRILIQELEIIKQSRRDLKIYVCQ